MNQYPQYPVSFGYYPQNEVTPGNYKTKKCRHFDSGKCKLGGLCNFAHGEEELRQFKTQDTIRTDNLTSVDKIPKLCLKNNTNKIQVLEQQLEGFYQFQKRTLEQLKFLTLNLNTSGQINSEDQVSSIENNIVKLYNEAVSYVHTINKVMDIGATENKGSIGDLFTDKNCVSPSRSNLSEKNEDVSPLSEILEQNEDELSPMKVQMQFILKKLRQLHANRQNLTTDHFEISFQKAESALKNNKVIEASQWLQAVLFDPNLDSRTAKIHLKIIDQAKSTSD
jgi:hypothetical protein